MIDQLIIPKRKSSYIYVREPQNGIYHGPIDKIIELNNKLPATARTMSIEHLDKYIKRNSVKTR